VAFCAIGDWLLLVVIIVDGVLMLLLFDVGDFGRFMKSSFSSIKPLLFIDDFSGDVSSLVGDFKSCDDDDGDDKSDDGGFLRQTSR
jgi:hypothetical protein